ncbi:DNA repair protein RecN [Stomatohabitans albus]|uniref:DNA repair protein RecN n=1 Tax=Stomatohabitans albus TaxID=3110766 RepID=UPI00300D5F85
MMPDNQHHPVLRDVVIEGLGLIDLAELTFQPGLNVLTGETGAGKTLVVTALQLLSGKRADKHSVQAGASRAVVQGAISPPPVQAAEWVHDEDEDLLIVREIAGIEGGRNRVRIQGRMAPVTQLETILSKVIELHGQHESLMMADADVQRSLLDRFDHATIAPLMEEWQGVWSQWRQARKLAHDARTNAAAHAREAAQLHREVDAIEAVNPYPGEEDDLKAQVLRIQHGEALANAYHSGVETLQGEGGVQDSLGAVITQFEQVAAMDPAIGIWTTRLNAISTDLNDVVSEIASQANQIETDASAFDTAMQRMAELKQLFRLYGATSTDVLAHADAARQRLMQIDGGEERLDELDEHVKTLRTDLNTIGERLHTARVHAATTLAAVVEDELADLAMGAATVHIHVEAGKPGPYGMDTVQFLITTNPGQPPVTLDKAASGGERSRIALALKVALADADHVPIMVFDEVDAGIGGQTAVMVGEKLQRLATTKQVLCVTHLAQIAAHADAHFLITKIQGKTTTTTTVNALDAQGREDEIARMLSGSPDEPVAKAHAKQLLTESARSTSLH